MFDCPLCGGKEKLYIRKSDGRFRCFRCYTDNGFGGEIQYALLELTDLSLDTIKRGLYGSTQEQASYLDLKMRDFLEDNEEDEVKEDLHTLTWPYHCIPIVHPGAKKGQDYLQGRGISTEIANDYQIRYSPQNRAVVFPVYVGEDLLGWQYRTIDKVIDNSPKTWSSPDLPRDKAFMFSSRLNNSDHAVLCEGPVDAIKAHLVGGNIAAMGKSISATHIAILLRSGIKKIYVGLDPDAFSELNPLMRKLDNIELRYVSILQTGDDKADLGSLSMEKARDAILSSETMSPNKLYIWLKPLTNISLRGTM